MNEVENWDFPWQIHTMICPGCEFEAVVFEDSYEEMVKERFLPDCPMCGQEMKWK